MLEEYVLPMDRESILLRDLNKFFTYVAKPAICKEYSQLLPYIDNIAEMILKDPEKDKSIGLSDVVDNFVRIMIKEINPSGKIEYVPNKAQIVNLYSAIKKLTGTDIEKSLSRSLTDEELKKLPADISTWILLLKAMVRDTFNSISKVVKDPKYTNELIKAKQETIEKIYDDYIKKKITKEEFEGLKTTYYKIFPEEVEKVYNRRGIEIPEPVKRMMKKPSYSETPQYMPKNDSIIIRLVNSDEKVKEHQIPPNIDEIFESNMEEKEPQNLQYTSKKNIEEINTSINVPQITLCGKKDLERIAKESNPSDLYVIFKINMKGE